MTSGTQISRRMLLLGGAALGLAGCSNAIGQDAPSRLDARVDATRDFLLRTYPNVAPMLRSAKGVLYMPLMTEAGFGLGGAYGQGALRINDVTVDYYSATQASLGFQIGAQQYAHVLIFQTDAALADFRKAPGWVAEAGAYYALPAGGLAVGTDTITAQQPVVAMVFGQSGLMAGAAIAGTKYSRIIPSTF
ncbi:MULTISPECIES: YSC84-related protein [unclassified Paracoccus (in: a-proteobacteria)]|uniref:lipid-binding SYLF domain-containing protein n=1 Tax=unclassified Paracoccus (in: a-proteobacteria) TaxID=2688777 RepID=UPI0012B21F2A|nr:YSC84-related protein [Paracoccus sp. SMMA_5]UXU74811.1 YSC84-related protein [Paracoccus sp. SMMA_5]